MASFGWDAKKARDELSNKVKGLTGGAEGYIAKPFEMLKLLIRIDKILKHFQQEGPEIHIKNAVTDPEKRTITREGQEINLKPMKFDCLVILTHNRNKTLTRKQLLAMLWLLFRGPVNSNL